MDLYESLKTPGWFFGNFLSHGLMNALKRKEKNPAFWEKGGWFDEEGIWWEKFVLAREELSAPQRTQRSRRRDFLQHRSDAKLVLITTC